MPVKGTRFTEVSQDLDWLKQMADGLRQEAQRLDARAESLRKGENVAAITNCLHDYCTAWYCSCILCSPC